MAEKSNIDKEIEKIALYNYPNDEILRKAFMFGAAWFYGEMIERSSYWLLQNIQECRTKDNFLDDYRKAMKGE